MSQDTFLDPERNEFCFTMVCFSVVFLSINNFFESVCNQVGALNANRQTGIKT